MVPPLAVDIDGTLSRADRTIDSRVIDPIRGWRAPVVIATGKALPYPVALAEFIGIDVNVIAENGGVSVVGDSLTYHGDREAADAVVNDFVEAGYEVGYGTVDLSNRWRETEVAVSRDAPLEPLEEIAEKYGLEVVDTEFAYHVKDPDVDKGTALEEVTETLGLDPGDFVAIGDSPNDIELFETVGRSYSVANGVQTARAAADYVTEQTYADGFLEVLESIA